MRIATGTASAAARAAAGLEASGVGSGVSHPYLRMFSSSRRRWVAKSIRNIRWRKPRRLASPRPGETATVGAVVVPWKQCRS